MSLANAIKNATIAMKRLTEAIGKVPQTGYIIVNHRGRNKLKEIKR